MLFRKECLKWKQSHGRSDLYSSEVAHSHGFGPFNAQGASNPTIQMVEGFALLPI